MTTKSVSDFDAQLLHDPYGSFSEEDFMPEPPDPLWMPTPRQIERYGPLEVRTDGPRRHSEFHDFSGLLPSFEIYQGNAIEVLGLLARKTIIHSVVTSIPYYKLRRYGDRPEELGWGSLHSYIDSICGVLDAVPLHRRGSLWVNIGDTRDKRGSLMGVPEEFRIAMKHRGWMIPDKVVWAKAVADRDGSMEGNCMPEPTPGRLNGNGHESIFRFVRGEDHRLGGLKKIKEAWTDARAVAVPREGVVSDRYLPEELMSVVTSVEGRALPNVWRIPMGQTRESHFAVFPAALSERPIAMTAPQSVCKLCGRPRERLVEMVVYDDGKPPRRTGKYRSIDTLGAEEVNHKSGRQDTGRIYLPRKPVTTGWSTCPCGWNWEPGTVLDPFAGTSSTGYSALLMGRNYIGIDLYPENCELSRGRCQSAIDYMRKNGLVPSLLQR
jgi:DNA modification methylase